MVPSCVVMVSAFVGLLAAQTTVRSERPAPSGVSGNFRLDVTQLVATDSVTSRRLIFTDLRGVAHTTLQTGAAPLSLEADVLGRIGYNEISVSRYDISRLFLEYGETSRWAVAVGRINLDVVNGTQVDGARFTLGVGEGVKLSAFGGLMPHPILRTFNTDFVNTGASYDVRSKTVNHGGGVSVQLYQGALDRAFVTERVYVRMGSALSLYARGVVDLITQSGFLGDFSKTPAEQQTALEKIDLSQAFATLRFAPSAWVDLSLSGNHMHALLPNQWWEDWVEQERARRGFTLDGPLPVGTRRSTARVVMNLHVSDFSPYVSARYDRRHEDDANGYEGQVGLKYSNRAIGYADVHGSYRQYFDADHQLVGAQVGLDLLDGLTLDFGGSALRVVAPSEPNPAWLYDVNGTLWLDLGSVFAPLRRAQVLAMYQAFIEPELVYQVFVLRVGYRLDL